MDDNALATLTAQIVSAHVGHNDTSAEQIPGLIQSVMSAFRTPAASPAPVAAVVEEETLNPAVPIKKSITPDYIVCLEDGKKMKMLKRHLMTSYRLTPEQYRARWNLPSDYPMVAPNYALRRSALAKHIGLGRKPEDQPVRQAVAVTKPKGGKVGRPRKIQAQAVTEQPQVSAE